MNNFTILTGSNTVTKCIQIIKRGPFLAPLKSPKISVNY